MKGSNVKFILTIFVNFLSFIETEFIPYDPTEKPFQPIHEAILVGMGYDGYKGYVGIGMLEDCENETMQPVRLTPYGGDTFKAGGYQTCNGVRMFTQNVTKYLQNSENCDWIYTSYDSYEKVEDKLVFNGDEGFSYYFAKIVTGPTSHLGKVYITGGQKDVVGAVYYGPGSEIYAKFFYILTCSESNF